MRRGGTRNTILAVARSLQTGGVGTVSSWAAGMADARQTIPVIGAALHERPSRCPRKRWSAALRCWVLGSRVVQPVRHRVRCLVLNASGFVAGDSCVFVGRDILKDIPAELTPENGIKASKFIIVGDSNVRALRTDALSSSSI